MAEALGAIGLASSLVQLITFSSKLLIRLTKSPSPLSKSLHGLQSDLLVLLDALHSTHRVVNEAGCVHVSTGASGLLHVYSAVENCRVQIEALHVMVVKSAPRPGDSWAMRSRRVFASLRQEAQVAEIRARVGDSVQVLMFWHVSVVMSGLLLARGRFGLGLERGDVLDLQSDGGYTCASTFVEKESRGGRVYVPTAWT